jgi:hypothetical protein
MANLLQSSQTQATTAPGFYKDYLTNIASGATAAIDPTTGAQYVGAQPLQEKAFSGVEAAGAAYKPTLDAAGNTLGTAATSGSPLSAANPYLANASGNLGAATTNLMSPYTSNVVNAIADAGQRNIMQNLAPQATAGAVGSGQFGSKRGAEVLGQTIQNANKDILGQQYQALNTGYNSALEAALKKQQLEGQLGSTAGNLASVGQQNLTAAGRAQLEQAKTNQELGLADINALSTLGSQQQTIAQNKELFPLTNLSTASSLLRGYNIPTSTSTMLNMSPLSALAGIGTGAVGLVTPGTGGKTPLENLKRAYNEIFGSGNSTDLGGGITMNPDGSISGGSPNTDSGLSNADLEAQALGYANAAERALAEATAGGSSNTDSGLSNDDIMDMINGGGGAGGGFINDQGSEELPGSLGFFNGGTVGQFDTSFQPHLNIGGLPVGGMPQYDQSNTYTGYTNTDGAFVPR